MNDVLLKKIDSIQRCIKRAREEYVKAGEYFSTNYSRQDAAILNMTRACEQAIDLANMVIKKRQLGIPARSRDSFVLLAQEGIIDTQLAESMQHMVGFRNIVIHQYQDIAIDAVVTVITIHSNDLLRFTDAMLCDAQKG